MLVWLQLVFLRLSLRLWAPSCPQECWRGGNTNTHLRQGCRGSQTRRAPSLPPPCVLYTPCVPGAREEPHLGLQAAGTESRLQITASTQAQWGVGRVFEGAVQEAGRKYKGKQSGDKALPWPACFPSCSRAGDGWNENPSHLPWPLPADCPLNVSYTAPNSLHCVHTARPKPYLMVLTASLSRKLPLRAFLIPLHPPIPEMNPSFLKGLHEQADGLCIKPF